MIVDVSHANEKTFWESFCQDLGELGRASYPLFREFYEKEFDKIKSVCAFTPKSLEAVRLVKELGAIPVLATSPLFPTVATEKRMAWAGRSPSDFALFTTYENSHYCRPSLDYYREVCEKIGVSPEECLMIGNDESDDMMGASAVGMDCFLVTDYLITCDTYKWEGERGTFEQLINKLTALNA
jgi:FMN phosphatase YigB (HAD superfamily)